MDTLLPPSYSNSSCPSQEQLRNSKTKGPHNVYFNPKDRPVIYVDDKQHIVRYEADVCTNGQKMLSSFDDKIENLYELIMECINDDNDKTFYEIISTDGKLFIKFIEKAKRSSNEFTFLLSRVEMTDDDMAAYRTMIAVNGAFDQFCTSKDFREQSPLVMDLKSQVMDLKSQVSQLTEVNEDREETVQYLIKSCDGLKSQVSQLTKENKELKETVHSLVQSCDVLKERYEALKKMGPRFRNCQK